MIPQTISETLKPCLKRVASRATRMKARMVKGRAQGSSTSGQIMGKRRQNICPDCGIVGNSQRFGFVRPSEITWFDYSWRTSLIPKVSGIKGHTLSWLCWENVVWDNPWLLWWSKTEGALRLVVEERRIAFHGTCFRGYSFPLHHPNRACTTKLGLSDYFPCPRFCPWPHNTNEKKKTIRLSIAPLLQWCPCSHGQFWVSCNPSETKPPTNGRHVVHVWCVSIIHTENRRKTRFRHTGRKWALSARILFIRDLAF